MIWELDPQSQLGVADAFHRTRRCPLVRVRYPNPSSLNSWLDDEQKYSFLMHRTTPSFLSEIHLQTWRAPPMMVPLLEGDSLVVHHSTRHLQAIMTLR